MKTIFQNIKQTFAIFALFALSNQAIAQAPNKMSYQTVVRNSSNALVTSQGVGIQISILQGSATGTALYVERHFPNTNANGLASVEIGSGTVMSGTFASIDWANGLYFTQTEIDPNGGSNYTISGTSQLMSVPYALHATTADALTGGGSGGSNWNVSGNNISSANSGNVGIGVTPPLDKVHIQGDLNAAAAIRVDQVGTDQYTGYRVDRDGVEKWFLGMNASDNDLIFRGGGASDKMVIKENGNVGIGKTAPSAELHIMHQGGVTTHGFKIERVGGSNWSFYTGDAGVNNELWLSHAGSTVGKYNSTSGAYAATSDKRFKTNIRPITPVLSKIMQLDVKNYTFKADKTNRLSIGLIAQEAESLFPELVDHVDGDGLEKYLMDYSGFSIVAIKAIQEQQKEKEAQDAKIEALEKQLEAMNAKLDALLNEK